MPKKSTARNLRPATEGMLTETRKELRAQNRSLEHKMDAGFKKVDARFETLESKMDQLIEIAHRTQMKVEEQERNNSVVYDSLHLHQQQHERIESSIEELQSTISWLAARNPIKP